MSETLPGVAFPSWLIEFDSNGRGLQSAVAAVDEIPKAGLTDLFIFSHGWNNDRDTAIGLYTRFFQAVGDVLKDPSVRARAGLKIGIAGVIWPSILFPGDTPPPADANGGGASSFTGSAGSATLQSELPKAFCQPDQQAPLMDLIGMLDNRPPSNDALLAFRDKLMQIVTEPQLASTQDNGEAIPPLNDDLWMQFLDHMADVSIASDSDGGAAGLGGFFDRLWNGAKSALRVTTYWEMKNRAGVVGKTGLGPLIGRLHAAAPTLRVHLLGHSFGARLVSYTLAGLPSGSSGEASPVKSLFLLQGAFSHFAFCSQLPFDASRSGDLKGMAARVDGPLLTTHSKYDSAVGVAYPNASFLGQQDASDVSDVMYRWEGMGCDGAQDPGAASALLGDVHTTYNFTKGNWLNLDGNSVIVAGGAPSGAHSDIVHPHTAWAALAAAGVVQ